MPFPHPTPNPTPFTGFSPVGGVFMGSTRCLLENLKIDRNKIHVVTMTGDPSPLPLP